MYNFLDKVRNNPDYFRQLSVDDQLITEFNCPLETQKEDMWTNQGYFVYVVEGKKIWHIPGRQFELTPGRCIFVKKGAHIVEQFFDSRFCVVVFFVSDKFITDTLRGLHPMKVNSNADIDRSSINSIDSDDSLHAFFNSVVPYFLSTKEVDKALLELKFRELILNVVHNPKNASTINYFNSLFTQTFSDCIRRIMEENFNYNLGIEAYARMCGRSLSAFKRDFEEHFQTTPGKWLLERRLQHAKLMIRTTGNSISEIAFDSGFENVSHFSRSFKQQFGSSPIDYRQSVEID